ncbi:hypothetical protein QOT17_018141 [Balamuthia mandrillaris]
MPCLTMTRTVMQAHSTATPLMAPVGRAVGHEGVEMASSILPLESCVMQDQPTQTRRMQDGCSPGIPCLGDVLLVIAPTSTNGGESSSASEGGKNTTITVFEKTTNTPVLVAELKHVTKSVLVEIKSVTPEQQTPHLPSNLRVISQAIELDVVIGAVKAEEEEGNSTTTSSSGSGSSSEEESQQVVVLTFSLGPTHQFSGLLKGDQTVFLGSAPAPPSASPLLHPPPHHQVEAKARPNGRRQANR